MGRVHDERGVTLVELLVAIMVLGIVIVPLTSGILFGYRAITTTQDTYGRSSDAQFLEIYFPGDVASATQALSSTASCTGTTTANQKVRFTSPSTGAGDPGRYVVYWTRPNGTKFELVRSVWNNTACDTAANQTVVVARNLSGLTGATATVSTKVVRLAVTTTGSFRFTVSGRMRV